MKSSPRPPRRFSRWQTTKRTFVLGEAVSKSNHAASDQVSKIVVPTPDVDQVKNNPGLPASQVYEYSDHLEVNLKAGSSQESTKPRHVRKLELSAIDIAEDGEAGNMERSETVKASGPASKNDSVETNSPHSTSRQNLGSLQINGHRGDTAGSGLASEMVSGWTQSNRNSPLKASFDSTTEKANLLTSAVLVNNITPTAQPRLSTKRISLSKKANNSAQEEENSRNQSNRANGNSKPGPSSPGADKENSKDKAHRRSISSESNLNSTAMQNKESVQEVSALPLKPALEVNKNRTVSEEIISSYKERSLRDRSKLTSPADLMKMRQYPEKFLGNAHKLSDSSKRKTKRHQGSFQKEGYSSPRDSTTSEHSSLADMVEKSLDFKNHDGAIRNQMTHENSVTSHNTLRQNSKLPRKIANRTDKLLNERDLNGNKTRRSPLVVEEVQSIKKRNTSKQSKQQSANSKSTEPEKSKNKTHLPSAKNKSQQSEKKSPSGTAKVVGNKHKQSVATEGVTKVCGDSVDLISQTQKSGENPPGASAETSLHSLNNNTRTVGRSMRDRSLLATPKSVQEKRQYPISFYPSKVRANILNSNTSAKVTGKAGTKSPAFLNSPQWIDSHETDQVLMIKRAKQGKVLDVSSKKSGKSDQQIDKPVAPRKKDQVEVVPTVRGSKAATRKPFSLYPDDAEATGRQPSEKDTSMGRKRSSKVLSLPRNPVKKPKLPGYLQDKETPASSSSTNAFSYQDQEPWEIEAPSRKFSAVRREPVRSKASAGSSIDETVLLKSQAVRKRKLVTQLSQAEGADKPRKPSQSQRKRNQEFLLWCEEGQTRKATDVMAYDVIFQAALDAEEELRDSAKDEITGRLVKKVFSGFKRNIKPVISQELSLKRLEKDVRERKSKCKKLATDLAEKQATATRLQKEVHSLETEADINMHRINQWMKAYSQLMLAVQDGSHLVQK